MENSNRILVTGATGTVGSPLVERLRTAGADVVTMSSRPGADRQADFGDPTSLARAFADIDTLFLLLPLAPGKLGFARHAVQAARQAGVKHIVRSSGAGADAASPAAIARLQGEIDALVIDSGIRWTLLRPSGFMQNGIHFAAEPLKGGSYFAPHGDGAMAAIDARDIAAAAAVVLANPAAHAGKVYTLTGPQALNDAQLVAQIAEATGRELRYVDVPEDAAREAMVRQGLPAEVIDWLMSLNHVIKQGWAAGLSDDVLRLTGRPPNSFSAFAREHASVWA